VGKKKVVSVGKCFVCNRIHYSHLGGWVFNGKNQLHCYELNFQTGELRTDCFEKTRREAEARMGLECNRSGLRTVSSKELLSKIKGNMEEDLQT